MKKLLKEKFNFKDTPITSDIELDAHWGTKLTSEQSETMKKSSEDALTLINNAKKMTIEVEKNVIKLVYHDQGTKKLYTTLAGAGLREALHKFLSQNKDVVDSVTLSVENERGSFSVPIIDDMVKDTNSLLDSAEQFIEPFEKATGYTAMNVTMNDVKNIISGVKIKIDLKDNKVFDEGNGEYTFKLEIQPTEGE